MFLVINQVQFQVSGERGSRSQILFIHLFTGLFILSDLELRDQWPSRSEGLEGMSGLDQETGEGSRGGFGPEEQRVQ